MRYTKRDLESGQATINCDPQTAYNRLAYLEEWWETITKQNGKDKLCCKECDNTVKDYHSFTNEWDIYCTIHGKIVKPNDFCSWSCPRKKLTTPWKEE